MIPITREEHFIQSAIDGVPYADAVTRIEMYFSKMAGGDVQIPTPVTRVEMYLAKLCGEDVEIPTPVTRIEMYLAKACGEDIEVPTPVTRVEMLLEQLEGESGEVVTVSGELPLTLANALAKPIKSLIRYGKVEQDGTPTPSAPVDIVCNNGVLQMVDNELPLAYKRITGIKFDGDFWYNTGEVLNGDDAITMTLANTATAGQNVFGSYNGTAGGKKNFSLFIYGGGSSSNCYYRYGDQLLRPRFGSNERTITISGNGTDGFTTDVTATPDTFTTEAPAYIGMLPNSSSAAYTGSIMGSIDVVSNGELRLRWIPCERQSDSAVGYYELKSGTFLEKASTGTPVKGEYDTSHMTVLAVVGTQEVLTVSADGETPQTASVPNLFGVDNRQDWVNVISGEINRTCGVLVLDGTEDWQALPGNSYFSLYDIEPAGPIPTRAPQNFRPISTHFPHATSAGVPFLIVSGDNLEFHYSDEFSDLAVFKAWLAEQYAAGTPVIMVYKLYEDYSEQTTPQRLSAVSGTNTVSTVASVSTADGEVSYVSVSE